MKFESQLQIVTAAGVPPFTVNQTALVINLNADLLDGQHGSYYAAASSLGNYLPLTGGTLTGTLTGTVGIFTTVRTTEVTSLLGSNGPITITPDGTGHVHINSSDIRLGPNNTNATLATRGTGDLILRTNEGSAVEGFIRIYDGANGNIEITPNGTGTVVVGKLSGSTASFSGQVTSTVATGTAPLVIASTTAVANLNADLLDGQHGSYYQDAGNLNAGTLLAARLPAFTGGDVTSSAGSAVLTLATVATAGTYRSVTVDAKGRVTAGTNPTTLAGYAISDAMKIGGAPGVDLNTLTTSGVYRINNTEANRPNDWGQLLVMYGGSDTITQIYGHYVDGTLKTRSGNPTNVGGSGSWSPWRTLLADHNYSSYALPLTGGTVSGTLTVNGGERVRVFRDGASTVTSHLYFANWANDRAYNWQLDENSNAALWGFGGTAWAKLLTITAAGAFNAVGAITQGGNQVLHAGNYSSYALPLTGGTISGAVTINANLIFGGTGSVLPGHFYTSTHDGTNVYFHVGQATGTNKVLNLRIYDSSNNFSLYQFDTSKLNAPNLQINGNQVLHAGNYSSYSLFSGQVSSGGNNGFANATWSANVRNPIWYFGNATTYGISYFQGSAGIGSADTIGIHPNGTATAAGSAFAVTPTASYVNNNVVLHAGNVGSYALPIGGGTLTGNVTAPRFISNVATGTAPFGVTSTTVVTNLNADLLDGQDGSFYQNAGNLNAGTLLAARLPAFTGGDVTSSAGSAALTLVNSGVSAGTYRSVTVDAKGRVTAGTNPTTLGGYGITDAMYQVDPNGFTQGDINGSGNMQRLWGTDSVQNLIAFRPPTTVEYTTDGVNWVATTISNDVFDGKVFGKWGGFNMNVGSNIGAWTKVRMTWVNFGYHFFSHFTLCHSTNGHSMNFVFYKSDLNGVFSSEAYRVNGISSWPGYTFTSHVNVSGWWDTRDVRMVFELNGNNGPSGYPNNAISIGHIGIMGGYSSFNRVYDWDGSRNITLYGNLTLPGNVTAPRFISNVATGTAPLAVTSTTLVTNLNAQYLNGQLGSYYAAASSLSSYLPLTGGTLTGALIVNNDGGVRASYDSGGSYAWLYGYGVEFGRATSYVRPNTNRSATLFVGGPSINSNDWLNIDFYSSGRFTVNNNAILHAGNYTSYTAPNAANLPYSWSNTANVSVFSGSYSYNANAAKYLLLWQRTSGATGTNGRFVDGMLKVWRGANHAGNGGTVGYVHASSGYSGQSSEVLNYTPFSGQGLTFSSVVYNSVEWIAVAMPVSDYFWEFRGNYGIQGDTTTVPILVQAGQAGVGAVTNLATGSPIITSSTYSLFSSFTGTVSGSNFSGPGTGLTGLAAGLSIGGSAAQLNGQAASYYENRDTTAVGFSGGTLTLTRAAGNLTVGLDGRYLPLTGGALTGTISIDTTGSSSSTSSVIIKRSGQSALNFGQYAGAWRSALQIQSNASDRLLFFAPPEADYQYGILRAANGGLKIDVGGTTSSTGTNAISIEASGAVSMPVSLNVVGAVTQNGNQVLHAGNYNSYAMLTTGIPSGSDQYVNFRVMRNSAASPADGMFIGYGNASSGRTRIYGEGSTTSHVYPDANGNLMRSDGSAYLHSSNYSSYALPLSGGTLTGALAGTSASFSGALSSGGNSVLTVGNYSSYAVDNTKRVKQFFWDSLSANASQARRFEIARIAIDIVNWNAVGSMEIELSEDEWANGLKKKYVITYGYSAPRANITLTEMSGIGSNNFQVVLGSEQPISGNEYYLPIYVDVRYYARTSVRMTTSRQITSNSTPPRGYTYINSSPSPTNISDFSADSTVNMSNAATAWQVGGNTIAHAGNFPSLNTYGTSIGNTIPDRVFMSNDANIKYAPRDTAKAHLGLTGKYGNSRPNLSGDANYWTGVMGWGTTDWNSVFDWGSGFTDSWSSPANNPGDASHHVGVQAVNYTNGTSRYGWQMVNGAGTNRWWLRDVWGGSFSSWREILHSANYMSYALPLSGGTLTGSRPVTIDPSGGGLYIKGDAGGWGLGYYFYGSSGTFRGGFGALGSGDSLTNFWVGPAYNNTWMTFSGSANNSQVALQQGGNQVLHAGNYTSYAPPYGSTGSRNVWTITDWNQTTYPNAHFLSSEGNTTNAPSTDFIYGLQTSFHRSGSAYRTQMVTELYSNPVSLWVRNSRDSDTWTSWAKLVHSLNYTDYTVTKTGTGASGTWGINITGSSASVSASADQAIVNQHNGSGSAWYGRILSKNSTNDRSAFLGTYGSVAGVFAHNNALTAWADLYINTVDGSSGGTVRMPASVLVSGNQVIHTGNYVSYSPSLTGGGASGTWGINISGSSASCSGSAAQLNGQAASYYENRDTTSVSISAGTLTLGRGAGNLTTTLGGRTVAWCEFNGNFASSQSPNASFNVSSITKNATGDYTVNFSSAIGNANYVVAGTAQLDSVGQSNYNVFLAVPRRSGAQASGSCRVVCEYPAGVTLYDCASVRVAFIAA